MKRIVAEQFGLDPEEIDPATDFLADLNADSLDAIEIIMCIEDEFGIAITDEDADLLTNVEMVLNYVEKKIM